ncbi:MAG: hypothetical protein BMS9Abin37_1829 [Acidobacteriota bacterium]|nr:MAG: hypothetical protein BMS9Abin37_1829 [Acidobacteriota bacterium]
MKTLRPVLALVGLAFAGLAVYWVGIDTLASMLAALRWAIPVLLVLGGLKHILRVRAWQLALRAEGIEVPFPSLFRARVGAQSLAYLASMGGILSEPLKPWLLRNHVAAAKTIAPTIVEAFIYWVTALAVIAAGVIAAAPRIGDDAAPRAIAAGTAVAAVMVAFALLQRRALLDALDRIVRARRGTAPAWRQKLRRAADVENQIRSFRIRHQRTVRRIMALNIGVQAAMLAEVWVVLSALGIAAAPVLVLAIEGASRLVKIMTFYIPGRIGADEAGGAASFLLLGLTPAAGLTLALARRAQALLWAGLGFLWLARADASDARSSAPEPVRGALVSETFRGEDLHHASTHRLAVRS